MGSKSDKGSFQSHLPVFFQGSTIFDDVYNLSESFNDLIREIYHEYVHVQNGYATHGEMNWYEDEFRAHFTALSNTSLPTYSYDRGRTYVQWAEGYYNFLPAATKNDPLIQHMYKVLVNHFKPLYGLPAKENPKQEPPKTFGRK